MDFLTAIKTCLTKYSTFQGRARRSEYWYFNLFALILILTSLLMHEVVYFIAVVALILPSISVSVRRLHDIGRSGWWWWVSIIPLLGPLLMLIFCVTDSEAKINAYGENPKA